ELIADAPDVGARRGHTGDTGRPATHSGRGACQRWRTDIGADPSAGRALSKRRSRCGKNGSDQRRHSKTDTYTRTRNHCSAHESENRGAEVRGAVATAVPELRFPV